MLEKEEEDGKNKILSFLASLKSLRLPLPPLGSSSKPTRIQNRVVLYYSERERGKTFKVLNMKAVKETRDKFAGMEGLMASINFEMSWAEWLLCWLGLRKVHLEKWVHFRKGSRGSRETSFSLVNYRFSSVCVSLFPLGSSLA